MTKAIVPLLTAAVVGGIASFILTPVATALARRLRILDYPGGYKAHASPVPLLGGLGLTIGTLFGAIAVLPSDMLSSETVALVVGTTTIVVAGVIDDVWRLPPQYKFLAQFLATLSAGLALALLGVRLSLFLTWSTLALSLLTTLWVVGVTNTVNFLDNMDGACAGFTAVAAFTLSLINVRSGETVVAIIGAALGGASLGFLPYNWPRALVFLGDTGSMFSGFLLASLAVMGVYTPGARIPKLAVFEPIVLLAIPIVDAAVVICLRLHAGQSPWLGDRRHLTHRLVRRGVPPRLVPAVLWTAASLCGVVATGLSMASTAQAVILLLLLALAIAALESFAGSEGLP